MFAYNAGEFANTLFSHSSGEFANTFLNYSFGEFANLCLQFWRVRQYVVHNTSGKFAIICNGWAECATSAKFAECNHVILNS